MSDKTKTDTAVPAFAITFREPTTRSNFRRDVLNRIVSDSLATVRIIGSDAPEGLLAHLQASDTPVLAATDVSTAKVRAHVVGYLKSKGYSVSAPPFRNDADDAILGYTLHVKKTAK